MHKPSIAGTGFWRLLKGLYGLKQAGRQGYLELNSCLTIIGFKRMESDWSMYQRNQGAERSIVTTICLSHPAQPQNQMLLSLRWPLNSKSQTTVNPSYISDAASSKIVRIGLFNLINTATLPNVQNVAVTFWSFIGNTCWFTWERQAPSFDTAEICHEGSADWQMCPQAIQVVIDPSTRFSFSCLAHAQI